MASARFRQPKRHRRPAPRGHERHHEPEDQVPNTLFKVRIVVASPSAVIRLFNLTLHTFVHTDMNKASTVKTCVAGFNEAASLRRTVIGAGTLVLRQRGAVGARQPNKQRVNIFLDGAVVEHFKAKTGSRGYQTLINEALKQAIQAESSETVVRQASREEMRRH